MLFQLLIRPLELVFEAIYYIAQNHFSYLSERIDRKKMPKSVDVIAPLQRLSNGKRLRRELVKA